MTLLIPAVTTGPLNVDTIYHSDALSLLKALPSNSVNCVVTSPPYFGLRDYGVAGQIGLEPTPQEYAAVMRVIFHEIFRVLRRDGTAWLNIGDSYAGSGNYKGVNQETTLTSIQRSNGGAKGLSQALGNRNLPGFRNKTLLGIPWRVAFALQDDGWILRSDIIWNKPNPMPESVRDRPTRAHEYVFLLTKSGRYWYDSEAVQELTVNGHPSGNGYKRKARLSYLDSAGPRGNDTPYAVRPRRNRRTVWTVTPEPNSFAHFATFPRKLIEPMILAGCPEDGVVLDPFMGSGTTALVARYLNRHYIGCDLNAEYVEMAKSRLYNTDPYADRILKPGFVQPSLFAEVV